MHMTVEQRDQFETLKSDWSPNYDFSHCPGEERPFRAVPHADPLTEFAADTPAELRDLVRDDHAMRTAGVGK